MTITKEDLFLVEKRLAIALNKLSNGRLNTQLSGKIAHSAINDIDFNNPALAHKGVNWFASQIIDAVDFSAI